MKRWVLLTFLLSGLALAQTPVGQISTRDVHALLWLPDGRILLGHHDGILLSSDGGKSWQDLVHKPNWDAMSLAWDGKRLVVAGHEVYFESDNLKGFRPLKPSGLPGLDLHGYAIHPRNPLLHYAYEAAGGLYMSQDGGKRWSKAPPGSPVMAVGIDGTLYLAIPGLGLLQGQGQRFEAFTNPEPEVYVLRVASDGTLYAGGKQGLWQRTTSSWKQVATGSVLALAVNPKNPTQLVWVGSNGQVWRK